MYTNAPSGLSPTVSPNHPNIQQSTDTTVSEHQKALQHINRVHQEAIKHLPPQIQQSLDKVKNLESPKAKKQLYTKTLKKWANNSLDGCTRRVKDYVDENTSKALLRGPVLVTGSVLAAAGLGAAAGAGIGFAIAGPPGIPPGAIIGAGVGAGIALTASVTAATVLTRIDFIKWKRSHRLEDMLPILREIYENHKDLNWTCPITVSLFEDPVMIPSGVTYEKTAILEALEKNNNKMEDYCHTMTITSEDLYTDFATIGCILSALENLAQKDLNAIDLNSDIRQGLESTLRDINHQIKQCESQGRILIKSLWDDKMIKAAFYKSYQERLNLLIRE